jgi:hypothetical protein
MDADFALEWGSVILLILVVAWSARLAAIDARRRGKSPLLVCVIVIFFFPIGAIAWLLFRPNPIAPK